VTSVPALTLESVSLRLGALTLADISFSLNPGEIFVILGPSGAGKSVLLETIAGFHRPDRGRIIIVGREVTQAPPEQRRIGFMFQDYALFPHLTVAQNIDFGIRFQGRDSGAARDERMRYLLARLDLERIAGRMPANLSGGEKQRVALARALAAKPELFLFDEPLSALDAGTRDELREELKKLLRELGIAAIFVTHDQTEAMILADRMAVIRAGALLQIGDAAHIFNAPADEFVARFVGMENIIEGRVLSWQDGRAEIELPGGRMLSAADSDAAQSSRVLVCIRPEYVTLSRESSAGAAIANRLQGRVVNIEAHGPILKIRLDCGFPLCAYLTRQSFLELGIAPGEEIAASVKAASVHVIGQPRWAGEQE